MDKIFIEAVAVSSERYKNRLNVKISLAICPIGRQKEDGYKMDRRFHWNRRMGVECGLCRSMDYVRVSDK